MIAQPAASDEAALLKEIVRYATLAPSGHNAQCWRFGTRACGPVKIERPYRGRAMILEAAPLHIKAGEAVAFERAFAKAQYIIASMPGYISHELQRCLERPDEYLLLVRWESVEAHEVGFRTSTQYQDWKRLLHEYYDPFPVVSHFELVATSGTRGRTGVSD